MKAFVLFFMGFFASQRFVLADVYHFAPAVPLLAAGYFLFKSPKQASVFVMMALFFTSDLGGQVYNSNIPIYSSTIVEIKYATYLAALLVLFRLLSSSIRMSSALLGFALLGLVTVTSFAYSLEATNMRDASAAVRDILILICICICLFDSRDEEFDLEPLYFASLGFLAGEMINLVFFFDRVTHGYMSFASIKSFVIFPLFYRLHADKRFTPFTIMLIFPVLLVMLAYNSKMVFVSVAFASLVVVIVTLFRKPSYIGLVLIGAFTLFGLIQVTLYVFPDADSNRILAFFFALTENRDILSTIENIDPIRFQQHYLFFSRGFFEVVFGNGIGAGISDTSGQLTMAANEAAFTIKEMRDGLYFNFHDIWIDFGLRFGVVTLIFIAFRLTKILSDPDTRIMGAVFLMILINATFSISGIFMAVLFYKTILQRPASPPRVTGQKRRSSSVPSRSFALSKSPKDDGLKI